MTDHLIRIDMKGTYTLLGPYAISAMIGEPQDDAIVQHYWYGGPEPTLFRDTTRLVPYLSRTIASHCNDLLTIVVPGLRYVYFNNLDLVSPDRHAQIPVLIRNPLPRFTSIFDIPDLAEAPIRNAAEEYQLTGVMNELDVVHITVRDFVTAVNEKRPMRFVLPATDLTVELNYSTDDFWDEEQGTTISYIDLSRC